MDMLYYYYSITFFPVFFLSFFCHVFRKAPQGVSPNTLFSLLHPPERLFFNVLSIRNQWTVNERKRERERETERVRQGFQLFFFQFTHHFCQIMETWHFESKSHSLLLQGSLHWTVKVWRTRNRCTYHGLGTTGIRPQPGWKRKGLVNLQTVSSLSLSLSLK